MKAHCDRYRSGYAYCSRNGTRLSTKVLAYKNAGTEMASARMAETPTMMNEASPSTRPAWATKRGNWKPRINGDKTLSVSINVGMLVNGPIKLVYTISCH